MKLPVLKALFLLSPVWAAIPAEADYAPDFSTGLIPEGITVANESGFEPTGSFYRHGWTAEGWLLERFPSKGYVLMAPSHTGEAEPAAMRSVLTLPAYDVKASTWLRWEAASMLAVLPESYTVEILAEGSDKAETIVTVDAENPEWTTRMIPLDKYAGKKCTVSFVCTSANRYELMISKIALTEPAAPLWSGKNTTPYFGDMSGTAVSGTVTNYGAPAEVAAVVILDAKGNETGRHEVGKSVGTTESFSYSVEGKAEQDIRTKYSVSLILADGSTTPMKELEGSYFSSRFTRRHLVDKGTGMWCVNCPTGTIQLETLKRRFGSSLIPVETHVNTSGIDSLANNSYFSALKYYAVPAFRMDRNRKGNNNFNDMEGFYDVPANHDVVFEKVDLSDPDVLKLRVMVKHPENETSGFKLGYVITADFRDPLFFQQNSTTNISGERFYFLPSYIPGDMVEFKHVSVTFEHAFEGMEATSSFKEGDLCFSTYEFSVPRPAILPDFHGATAVAFALDDKSSLVLNAASVVLDKDFEISGVKEVNTDNLTADGTAEYYTLQGIRVATPSHGIFIRRQGNKSSKIILK